MLELEDRLGVEQVRLAFAPPLVLPADLEGAVRGLVAAGRVGTGVPLGHLRGDDVEADAAQLGGGAGERPSMTSAPRPMASKICAPV